MKQEGRTVDYRDVVAEPRYLDEMLQLTGGVRRVPVLVTNGTAAVGFGRGS